MDEHAAISELTGEAGGLAGTAKACHGINDGLTKSFDAIFGPDHVDTFDASCNTCKHFQRRNMTPVEKAERNIFGMPGLCLLKDIPTRGWQRGQYCGFENAKRYENRRTGKRPSELRAPWDEPGPEVAV